jgi:hypothetical protein
MIYDLDTEFIEDGKTIDLISLALVAADGRKLYIEFTDVDWSKADDWVNKNVKPHLWSQRENKAEGNAWVRDGGIGGFMNREEAAREVRAFLDPERYGKPEIWGYFADYDWCAFCQLFGKMVDLPEGYPMFCRDIQQLCMDKGNLALPIPDGEHHALDDAMWNQRVRQWLQSLPYPDPTTKGKA